jgi:ethanolamine kinase
LFIQTYLKNYLEREPETKEVESILAEIPIFEAASHAFWILWALYQANTSEIDFDYIDYAFKRFEEYSKIVAQIKSS